MHIVGYLLQMVKDTQREPGNVRWDEPHDVLLLLCEISHGANLTKQHCQFSHFLFLTHYLIAFNTYPGTFTAPPPSPLSWNIVFCVTTTVLD